MLCMFDLGLRYSETQMIWGGRNVSGILLQALAVFLQVARYCLFVYIKCCFVQMKSEAPSDPPETLTEYVSDVENIHSGNMLQQER